MSREYLCGNDAKKDIDKDIASLVKKGYPDAGAEFLMGSAPNGSLRVQYRLIPGKKLSG